MPLRCGSDDTAELDRALAELYRAALAKAGAQRGATEAAQKQWLVTRDARCGRAKPDQNCVEGLYKARIEALSRAVRAPDAKGSFITGRYAIARKARAARCSWRKWPTAPRW